MRRPRCWKDWVGLGPALAQQALLVLLLVLLGSAALQAQQQGRSEQQGLVWQALLPWLLLWRLPLRLRGVSLWAGGPSLFRLMGE